MPPKKIWALLDERQGNTNQTLGVAEALGLPFETKQIRFNRFTRLPDFLIRGGLLYVDNAADIAPPWPDIVISTARRLGLVSAYIKARNPACFNVQVQHSGLSLKSYSLLAAPRHDHVRPGDNIFETLGAPHRVTQAKLHQEAQAWADTLSAYPTPRIALLIGGSTGSHSFTPAHARRLAIAASALATQAGGSLLITTSRRTGASAERELLSNITCPYYLHSWDENNKNRPNPYFGYLGLADAVIATGDSVSMCSEACATGKPVFVFTLPDFISRKHGQFLQAVFEEGLAKPLHDTGNVMFTPPYRLDDAAAIALQIRARLGM